MGWDGGVVVEWNGGGIVVEWNGDGGGGWWVDSRPVMKNGRY